MNMFKRTQYVVLGSVVVLTLVVLNLPPSATARLKLAVGALFLPLFGLSSAGQQAASQGSAALLPRSELVKALSRLERENKELRILSNQWDSIRNENARLLKSLGRQPQLTSWKPKFARVVARDPANWWRTVQIDVGALDGVTNNLAVLTPDGLVGRILAAGLTRSQVILVGSPDCPVAALVKENREEGTITTGRGAPLDSSYVVMNSIGNTENFKPGLTVLTSGKGGIFPPGIVIGTIADVRSVDYGLYKQAQVKLAARLGALEEVWVLMP
jgi:rod shape-determining protein MreC